MRGRALFFALFFLVLASADVAAQLPEEHVAGPAEAEADDHGEGPWTVIFRWINFAILFGGLGYLLRKPFREFFQGRHEEIRIGLDRARESEKEAQARMADIEERLSRLSVDIAALRTEADRETEAERHKVMSEARHEVDRVVEQSRQEIERIARGVQREIKETVANLVIDHAEARLRTDMTNDDQKRVVVRFVKNL